MESITKPKPCRFVAVLLAVRCIYCTVLAGACEWPVGHSLVLVRGPVGLVGLSSERKLDGEHEPHRTDVFCVRHHFDAQAEERIDSGLMTRAIGRGGGGGSTSGNDVQERQHCWILQSDECARTCKYAAVGRGSQTRVQYLLAQKNLHDRPRITRAGLEGEPLNSET